MDIRFDCIFEGRRLFQVFTGEDSPLFTGTYPQCKRFIEVYNEKVLKSRFRDRKLLKELQAQK